MSPQVRPPPTNSNRDAGLLLSAYVTTPPSLNLPKLPILEATLSTPALSILELGAGCGIVGITLAHTLPNISNLILTDLPEATEILSHNLSLLPSSAAPITHQILDWSQPLPSPISSTPFKLVIVADCTYNPDVVPDLVTTLSRLREGNEEVQVVVAMKVRHESEMVFFELMDRGGWVVREKCKLPLLVLGDVGDEEIEVFVFGNEADR